MKNPNLLTDHDFFYIIEKQHHQVSSGVFIVYLFFYTECTCNTVTNINDVKTRITTEVAQIQVNML